MPWINDDDDDDYDYSMDQSPSRGSNSCSGSQEIPCILWNSKVHFLTHKSLPLFPVLCQIKPVYTPLPNLMFCGSYIVIYLRKKNQKDALFYSQFISVFNLYMFQAGLLLIIRR